MKLPSRLPRTSPLRFLAAASSSSSSMSSRSSYRGARYQWHRGFSAGRERFPHDPNLGFRPPPPPPNAAPPPPFRPPYQQQFRSQQPQRPPDFRNWEFPKLRNSSSHNYRAQFKVLSYNLLAEYLAINHRGKLYFHIPRHILDWNWRKRSIFFELGLWSADILCFQEVDRFHDLEEELKLRGYNGTWKMRTGEPIDGCAIFWRASRFSLLHEECIEYNKLGLRDNVAQICVFELVNQKNEFSDPQRRLPSNKVVICNIHVLYNPRRGEIKLGQVRVLLDRAHAVSKHWNNAPVVLCGDFNCTPKSPLYNYISEQKLDLSDLPRDKVSGQASAEIRPQWQSGSNFRAPQFADYGGGATQTANSREISQLGTRKSNNEIEYCENKVQLSSSIPSTGLEKPLISQGKETLFDKNLKNGNEPCAVDSSPEDTNSCKVEDTNSCKVENPILSIVGAENSPSFPVSSNSEMLNSSSEVNVPSDSSPNGVLLEKMENLSLDETDESDKGDVGLREDSAAFLSDLHDGNDSISHSIDSEPVNEVYNSYDLSAWTPIDRESATGSLDCTFMEHSLKLKSSYTEVEDLSGTRDCHGEPLVTSYNRCFLGTVDYIWRSEGLKTVRVLAPIPKQAMQWTPGFPTKKWGSDHIALVSELAFTNDSFTQDTEPS